MTKKIDTINIGIFGHIDHGKTTLLEKLSGKWTDTHSEELKRGITIKLGYADTIIYKDKAGYNIEKKGDPVKHVSFVDAPGHEMLMATTLSGAALIDAAILVVAANEGIKPQTREHLMTLKAKRVKNLIVIQNKIDLVEKEKAKKNYEEILSLLGDEHKNAPIIPASAQQGVNIQEILKTIAELPLPERDLNKTPVFLIARSFDVNKPGTIPKNLSGTVLGGTLKQGQLRVGDEIEIKPGRIIKKGETREYKEIKTKVVSLFKGSSKVDILTPGGSASIETNLDMVLGKSDSLSGSVASLSGKLPEPQSEIKLHYTLFKEILGAGNHTKIEPIQKGETLMLSVNTSTTGGNIKDISKETITIMLKIPLVAFQGDNIGIAKNFQGHWRLIGHGEII